MSVVNDILTGGFDKNGEAEFGVRCSVRELTFEQMKELRAMITVAIGTMEQMWRVAQQNKPTMTVKDKRLRSCALPLDRREFNVAVVKEPCDT